MKPCTNCAEGIFQKVSSDELFKITDDIDVVFKNIPTFICDKCGHKTIGLRKADQILKKLELIRDSLNNT